MLDLKATQKNELFNTLTHAIGSVVAVAGLVVLVVVASLQGDPWKIVSFSIYGATLVLLYVFSSLYHGLKGRAKKVFRYFDHTAIFLLIAGTYTPFTLVTLRGAWGWSIFAVVWGLAAIGIVVDVFLHHRKRLLPILIYICAGWLIIFASAPLLQALPMPGFLWLLFGGVLYTSGVFFYAVDKKLWPAHGIWHLFVLGGSACHYVTVLVYVA
ncbi:MAG: hemolysin III family protein [Syntrophales bacterium]|jgi:hemolysin III|nr:hemolysin III family protein [Syntrophales bacterium]NLN59554.1 hemolysin III family protein [Deltaproteobacteria bacterium]